MDQSCFKSSRITRVSSLRVEMPRQHINRYRYTRSAKAPTRQVAIEYTKIVVKLKTPSSQQGKLSLILVPRQAVAVQGVQGVFVRHGQMIHYRRVYHEQSRKLPVKNESEMRDKKTSGRKTICSAHSCSLLPSKRANIGDGVQIIPKFPAARV